MKNIGIFLFSFLLFPPTADYTTSRHSFHSFHLNTLTPWSWCEIRKSLQRLASFPMILTVKVSRGCPSRSKDDRNPNSSRSRSERGGSSFFLSFYRQVCTRRTILPFSFSPWTWNSLTSRQENLGTRRFHEEEKQRSIFLLLLNDKISSLLNITDFCIKVLSRNVSKFTYAATKWNLLTSSRGNTNSLIPRSIGCR